MKPLHRHIIFSLLLFAVSAKGQIKNEFNAQEKILYNAKIFTANSMQPYAEAIAIKDKKIVAIGNLSEVKEIASDKAEMINLYGKCLLPGFVDSHNHAIKGGNSLNTANVYEKLLSPDELLDYATQTLSSGVGMTGDVLLIYGINIATWSDIAALDLRFNSGKIEKQAVLLRGSDGHTAWANGPMLEKAGINNLYFESLPETHKKYFGTDQSNQLNGFVADSGLQKLFDALPKNAADFDKGGIRAMEYNNSVGITAWLDPSAAYINENPSAPYLDAYLDLAKQNKLSAHVAATIVAQPNEDPQLQINIVRSIQKKYNRENLSVIGFKIFADGVIEYPTQTAALSMPYTNSGDSGKLLFDPVKFAQFATASDNAGLLVHVHAIGDRAVTQTLNGFAIMRQKNGDSKIPHTITHLQIVLPDDFKRFHELGVLASMQLLWAFGDETAIDIVQPYIARQLFKYQYPSRSLLQAGAIICGASDWPVSSANPFEAIARAETRKGPLGVLDSTQCMPRIVMFYAYTINSAKALMLDKQIGSLEPGKSADMILVDRDVFIVSPDQLKETKVEWTMFEGKIVYSQAD